MEKEYKFSKWTKQEKELREEKERQEEKDRIEKEKDEQEKNNNGKERLEKTTETKNVEEEESSEKEVDEKKEIENWIEENFEKIESKLSWKGFEIKDKDFSKTHNPDYPKIAYNSEIYSGKIIDYLRDPDFQYRELLKSILLVIIDGNEKKTDDFINYLIEEDKIVIKRFNP